MAVNIIVKGLFFLLNNPYWLICERSNVMLEKIYSIKIIQTKEGFFKSFNHFSVYSFYAFKGVLYTYLLIIPIRGAILRNLIISERISPGYLAVTYLHIDPIMTLGVLKFHFIDDKTILATSLLALFALYIDYSLTFQSDLPTTQMMYEINIDNIEHITALNAHILSWPNGLTIFKPLSSFRKISGWLNQIWDCNSLNFYHQKLTCYPNLSQRLRARMMIISLGLELVHLLIILLVGKFLMFTEKNEKSKSF